MTQPINKDAWLSALRTDYLETFVPQGGAAIKFGVPVDGADPSSVIQSVEALGDDLGFFTATVRSDETRLHMIDQVYFKIASQVPWMQLTGIVLTKLATELGYRSVAAGEAPFFERLAAANGVEPRLVLMELRQKLNDRIFTQKRLAKDFRVAMTQLCLSQITGGPAGLKAADALLDWLTGRNTLIAPVKPYYIFSRITRANARHMLESLFHWAQFAGAQGSVVMFDLARLAVAKNPKDERVHYSKTALLDAYEVFRQFIDSIDRMRGCLLVACPDPSFLDEANPRGIGAYTALKARIFDEVRDERLANPMAALVRIDSDGGAA